MRRHLIRLALTSILLTCTLLFAQGAFAQAGQYIVSLRTSRPMLLANGRDRAIIIAEVRDASGRQAGNGLEVFFQTSFGTLSSTRAQTFGGIAQVELTSNIVGVAKVSATFRGVSNLLEVNFTDNPEEMYQGNNYLQVTGGSYNAYSVTDRTIEVLGKDGGSRVGFRNVVINADRMHVRCDDMIVRAINNVMIKRGKKTQKLSRLYYSLALGKGYAIAEYKGRLQTVAISGNDLALEPLKNPIPNTFMALPTLQVRLVIVARSITYFPGEKLQFRQPKFYQDQVQLLTMPYYEMALNSEELFSDQFISVGTNGFGLELPIYAGLTPTSKTIFYLRHQQQVGRGYFSQSRGWSLDAFQGYNSVNGNRSEGTYGFTGLARGDWGFRWLHNHEFNAGTQGSMYLDFPQHQGVLSNINLNQQQKKIRWGTNFTAGQLFGGTGDRSIQNNFYAETQPRTFMRSKEMLYTFGTNLTNGSATLSSGGNSYSESTQNINLRAFSKPIPLDKRWTLSHSYTFGQTFTNYGESGITTAASFSLDHVMQKGGTFNFTYDFLNAPASNFGVVGHHRIGVNYNISSSKRTQISIFGSAFADTPQSSILLDMVYRFNGDWRTIVTGTFQKFDGQSFNDLQLTLGRRIGARELQLTYSTFLKRISLDLTATRF